MDDIEIYIIYVHVRAHVNLSVYMYVYVCRHTIQAYAHIFVFDCISSVKSTYLLSIHFTHLIYKDE